MYVRPTPRPRDPRLNAVGSPFLKAPKVFVHAAGTLA